MRFSLIDEQRRTNAIDFIKSLDLKNRVEVLVNIAKKKRSNPQNNTMWMWYPYLSEYTGYTEEELHEIFKAEFMGYDIFYYMGIPFIKPKSTTKLTTKGMAGFLNRIDFIARFLEVKLPYPDDWKYGEETTN